MPTKRKLSFAVDVPVSKARRSRRSKSSVRTMVARAIMNAAELKREILSHGFLTFNHDAGAGALVGGYGHPASNIGNNWLGTVQGDGKHQRNGDQIFSKYVEYSFFGRTFPDRWQQVGRLIIVAGTGDNNAADYNSAVVSDWFVADGTGAGSGNLITQPIDTNKYRVLVDTILYPKSFTGFMKNPTPAAAPFAQQAADSCCYYPCFRGRININRKIQYKTGTSYPIKPSDRIQYSFIPYQESGTLTSTSLSVMSCEIKHVFTDI